MTYLPELLSDGDEVRAFERLMGCASISLCGPRCSVQARVDGFCGQSPVMGLDVVSLSLRQPRVFEATAWSQADLMVYAYRASLLFPFGVLEVRKKQQLVCHALPLLRNRK